MSSEADNPIDRDKLIRDAWRRLTRLEIETHRIKAMLARVAAMDEDRAADELARLLNENQDDADFASALSSFADDALATEVGEDRHPGSSPAGKTSIDTPEAAAAPTKSPPTESAKTRIDPPHSTSDLLRGGKTRSNSDDKKTTQIAVQSRSADAKVGESKPVRPWRKSPPWVTSVAIHLGAIVVLALFSIAAIPKEEPWLAATVGDPDESAIAELSEVEITLPETPLDAAEPAPLDMALADLAPLAPLDVASQAESMPLAAAGEFAFAELPLGSSGLLEAGGDGEGNQQGSPAASFFGAEAKANRIVFIVDNSNSMDEGRFETALNELARSVDSLSPEQSFYVVFYSDTAYRLFHPLPVDALVPATLENKQRLRAWLSTVQMCVGGRIVDAFKVAAELEPQVVYLLSDGVISQFPIAYLTDERDWDFTVHTIGMTVPDAQAAQNLLVIAEANRGVFLPVGVSPLAAELARRRPIPKNRTRGPVWGLKLPEHAAN